MGEDPMTDGQKYVMLLLLMLVATAGIVWRHYLYGTFDMGDRLGTIGLMTAVLAFLFGTFVAALFPEAIGYPR